MGGLRGGGRASARRSPRSGPQGKLPPATVPPDVYSEGGRPAAAAGDRSLGGQDRPRRRRHGAERHLRGRLPRLLLRVPARTGTARCARRFGGGDQQPQGELHPGCRRGKLLRSGRSDMDGPLPGTPHPRVKPGDRQAHHPPDPEMDEGGGAGGRDRHRRRQGDGAGGGDFTAARQRLPALRFRSLG